MSGVQLRELHHDFGQSAVLDGLDLDVKSGEYLVLLGSSGCGKTTTLRAIAGLIRPNRGSVWIGGKCVDRVAPRRRDVSMVFQNDALYPHLTLRETIAFALRGRLRGKALAARTEQAAQLAGATTILDRYPEHLSGGELRRGAIAKAFARQASVRLMDEPLSALDATVRHAIGEDLANWHAEVPGTTIHVTHDGQEAVRLADRIAVMDKGKIIQLAPTHEIYERPQTLAVARAIGSPPINLIPFDGDGGVIPGSVTFPSSPSGLVIGFRPDSVRVATTDSAVEPVIDLLGTVTRIATVDGADHVRFQIGMTEMIAVLPPDCGLKSGDTRRLWVDADRLHFFESESGQRITFE